jgi:hypothetical protein
VNAYVPEARVNHLNSTAIHSWCGLARQPLGCARQLSVDPDIILVTEGDVVEAVRGLGQHGQIALSSAEAFTGSKGHPPIRGGNLSKHSQRIVGGTIITDM